MRPATRLTGILLLVLLTACGGRPTKTLAEAENALADAILAKKCAPEEYAAAERMYAKANALADEGKNDEAAAAARAAKKLAEQARQKAMLRKDECLKPKQDPTINPDDFIDRSGAGLDDPDAQNSGGLKTVYFDFNAFDLTPEARQTMTSNAQWLLKNADKRIIIEGHCDSRGSTEYNLALGEKRGQVARKYLVQMGVDPNRMSVVSYGEEQPLDFTETEGGHAKNRRAEFTVR